VRFVIAVQLTCAHHFEFIFQNSKQDHDAFASGPSKHGKVTVVVTVTVIKHVCHSCVGLSSSDGNKVPLHHV